MEIRIIERSDNTIISIFISLIDKNHRISQNNNYYCI